MNRITGYMVGLLLTACSITCGQQQLSKTFKLGDLAYVEASEPCGWICFDRGVQVEREGRRCYLNLQKNGSFKLAALSKTSVGDVLAYYTITVQDGDSPGPTPDPDPPIPVPDDIPNALGLGKSAYDEAKLIGDKVTSETLYRIWGNASIKMSKVDPSQAINARMDAMDAIWKADIHDLSELHVSAKWTAWRASRQAQIQGLENSGKLPGPAEHAAAMKEISLALRSYARSK